MVYPASGSAFVARTQGAPIVQLSGRPRTRPRVYPASGSAFVARTQGAPIVQLSGRPRTRPRAARRRREAAELAAGCTSFALCRVLNGFGAHGLRRGSTVRVQREPCETLPQQAPARVRMRVRACLRKLLFVAASRDPDHCGLQALSAHCGELHAAVRTGLLILEAQVRVLPNPLHTMRDDRTRKTG